MNYKSEFDILEIKDGRWINRYLKFISVFKLAERSNKTHNHHILPVSLFPQYKKLKLFEWNSAILTIRAHHIAHYMLAKALGGKMWFAFNNMNAHNKKFNSRLYELALIELREQSKIRSKNWLSSNEHPRGMKGKKHSAETLKLISLSSSGRKRSEEAKEKLKISKANRTEEEIRKVNEKISLAKKGYKHTDEARKKMSMSKKGKPSKNKGKTLEEIHGEERGKLLRESNHRPSKNKGKTYEEIYGIEKAKELKEKRSISARNRSKESRKQLSNSLKGKKRTAEHIKNMKESKKDTIIMNKDGKNKHIKINELEKYEKDGWKKGVIRKQEKKYKCEYCSVESIKSNITRWHNEKCKFRKKGK